MTISQFPHCDQRVLHAPGECTYCDDRSEWQELREAWGINYTGQYDPQKQVCPAERKRGITDINRWYGNVPVQDDAPTPSIWPEGFPSAGEGGKWSRWLRW